MGLRSPPIAQALRRFDPYPEAILALDFADVRTGGRQWHKRDGIIVPRFEMLRGAASVGHAGFGVASVNGALRRFAPDAPLIGEGGLLVPELRTNKNSNFNANPTDLTGVTKSGDAAATLTVVDDVEALAAAGLQGLCTGGKVFCLDNSAGVTSAFATFSGAVGNTNAHAASVFGRASAAGLCRIQGAGATGASPTFTTGGYGRYVAVISPLNTSAGAQINCGAGGIAYFILNQLEEGSFATAPIVVQGAPATRTAVAQSVGGQTLPSSHSGAVRFRFLGTDSGAFPVAVALDNDTADSRLVVFRANSSGAISVLFRLNGTDNFTLGLGNAALGVEHVISWRAEAGNHAACLNGGTVSTSSSPIALPAFTHLRAGHVRGNSTINVGNGLFSKSLVFDKPLPNSRLQSLASELAA